MKRYTTIFAILIILTTACQKDDIQPSKPFPKIDVTECKKCEAGWDLTDTIP